MISMCVPSTTSCVFVVDVEALVYMSGDYALFSSPMGLGFLKLGDRELDFAGKDWLFCLM